MIDALTQRRGPLRRAAIAAIVGVILGGVSVFLPQNHLVQGWITDLTVAARAYVFGAEPLDSEHVVVIGLDQRSLEDPQMATRPRALFSPIWEQLGRKALRNGGQAFLLDFILAYDAVGLKIDGETPLRGYDNDFLRFLRERSDEGNVVIGRSSVLLPTRRFHRIAGSEALGLVEIPLGPGNVIRNVAPELQTRTGEMLPTLVGRALSVLGQPSSDPIAVLPPGPITTLPTVSAIDVLQCADPARLGELFDGRVVLVGTILPGEDRVKTADRLVPRGPTDAQIGASADPCAFPRPVTRASAEDTTLPGVFAHAAALDGVLSGWAPSRAPDTAVPIAVGLLTFAAALAALVIRPTGGAVVLVLLLGAVFAIGVLFLESGLFLMTANPMVMAPVAFALTWGVRLRLLDRRANRIRREFGKFLAPMLVEQMIESGETPQLGGEEREVTVMFADLSGFTATSQTIESAELTAVLNRYLDLIAGVIRDHGGYIDKFVGDAVMAIWNAPAPSDNHGLVAVRAARAIVIAIREMAAADRASGRPGFDIKIGINSGRATVGNVGALDRMNYTVVGETVNLAARFESLPAVFKTPIVAGAGTASMIASAFHLLPIVSVQVKGTSGGVRIFAPYAEDDTLEGPIGDKIERYAKALAAFEVGDFDAAAHAWSALAEENWPGSGPARVMCNEAQRMATEVVEAWSGVFEARSK